MGRAVNPDGNVFRGVLYFCDPNTGEEKYQYSPAYANKAPCTAFINGAKRAFYHGKQTWVQGTGWVDVPSSQRIPFVESYLETVDVWRRV